MLGNGAGTFELINKRLRLSDRAVAIEPHNLPLQFLANETPESVGLTGKEVFEITGLAGVLAEGFPRGKELVVKATRPDGSGVQVTVTVRIDTPQELQYYRHGGILEYVLRQLSGTRAP